MLNNLEFKIKNDYPALIKEVLKNNDEQKKSELFDQVWSEEDKYREIFAQDRSSPTISDPHVMLIDTFKHHEIFQNLIQETDTEKQVPRIFAKQHNKAVQEIINKSATCIVDHKEFLRNFTVFTEDVLRYINW